MKARYLLVDDEPMARVRLERLIMEIEPDAEVLQAGDGDRALTALTKEGPFEACFLDVEMPGMTGFEMLQEIKQPDFEIIFTTAFDKYSIEAIRYSALDYLLKPVMPHELKAAIEKMEHKQHKNINKQFKTLFQHLDGSRRPVNHVALPSMEGLTFVNVIDIIHCESDSNYTTLFLKTGEKMVVTKTLKDIEGLLHGNNFYRIHNSHLINMHHIKKYVKGNAGYVVMNNGADITVARNRKEDFLKQFAHL